MDKGATFLRLVEIVNLISPASAGTVRGEIAVMPLPEIVCPSCGEADRLHGRRAGDTVEITCESCEATWERDARPRCRLCGSEDLRYTPEPLWERVRGDQRTPTGRRDAWACNTCGGRDVTSAGARPPGEDR
jgi:hypothetical protein